MPQARKNGKEKFSLVTQYLGDQLDLKKLQEGLKKYSYLNRDHPLVLELTKRSYVVLTKFGTVTFWNAPRDLAEGFVREVAPFVRNRRDGHRFTDTLIVHVGDKEERITFEEVFLRRIDLEKVKIISYVSAQSVALDRYEWEIDERLKELGKVVEDLKTAGRTTHSQTDLLKQVGNVLSVKQNAVSSLSLFDKPTETWKQEEIEHLYVRLREAYELRDRFDVLNEKIDFLSENNTTLINFTSAQKGNLLEFIILVLIVVEIIIFLLDIFKVF